MNVYIATPGTRVGIRCGRIEVREDENLIIDYPLGLVDSVTLFPGVNTTPAFIKDFAENLKSIFWINSAGKVIAMVSPPGVGNITRLKKQYSLSDNADYCLSISRKLVSSKITNQLQTLCEFLGDSIPEVIIAEFIRLNDRLPNCKATDEIMGLEGTAARIYFDAMAGILPSELGFHKRTRQPPRDCVSSALGFAYSLLYNKYAFELMAAGVDPNLGFLHKIRTGHYALASDMMEELRPVISDKIVFSMCLSGELTEKDFDFMSDGAIYLSRQANKKIIAAFEAMMAKDSGLTMPRGTSADWKSVITNRTYELIRSIESEDADAFHPLIM